MGRGLWRRLSAVVLVAAVLASPAGSAEAPPVARCSALLAQGRALVDVTLERLFSAELLKLVALGLMGRVKVEVTLLRRQPFWFDEVVAEETREIAIRFSRSGGGGLYVVDGRKEVREVERLDVDRIAVHGNERLERGERYRVEVKAHLQVVTASSLREVARWVTSGSAEEQSALSRGVLEVVASDLGRRAEASCDVEPLPPRPAADAGP
jgi:hypothetical protein